MITIIPSLDILKTVTDQNIRGASAERRRDAFDKATKLIAEADIDVLLTYQIYKRIESRLLPDHIAAFESLYRIDKSTKDVHRFNTDKSVYLVGTVESRGRRVIILTSNLDRYSQLTASNRIIATTPTEFISKVRRARDLQKLGVVSSFREALSVSFFWWDK